MAKHIFQSVPRLARAEWFNVQLILSSYSTDVVQRTGQKSSRGSRGQDGVRMPVTDTPDPCKELKKQFLRLLKADDDS